MKCAYTELLKSYRYGAFLIQTYQVALSRSLTFTPINLVWSGRGPVRFEPDRAWLLRSQRPISTTCPGKNIFLRTTGSGFFRGERRLRTRFVIRVVISFWVIKLDGRRRWKALLARTESEKRRRIFGKHKSFSSSYLAIFRLRAATPGGKFLGKPGEFSRR